MEHASLGGVDDKIVRLSEVLGAEHLAINRYRIRPGDGFPGGLHAHADQEEVFVILAGEATFETLAGAVTVGANESIRFAPGEFQSGYNAGDDTLVAVALGAPRDSTDVRVPATCHICGHDALRIQTDGDEPTFVCPECDEEHTPLSCPDCGVDDLRFTVDSRTRPVVECVDCGATFDDAPLGR